MCYILHTESVQISCFFNSYDDKCVSQLIMRPYVVQEWKFFHVYLSLKCVYAKFFHDGVIFIFSTFFQHADGVGFLSGYLAFSLLVFMIIC